MMLINRGEINLLSGMLRLYKVYDLVIAVK
jgi:hypothetical protein